MNSNIALLKRVGWIWCKCNQNLERNESARRNGETALEVAVRWNNKDAADAIKTFTVSSQTPSPSPLSDISCTSSTATASNFHFSTLVTQRMRTTTPTRQPPRQVAGKGDEQLVEQLIQQIEQLRNEGTEKDREIAEMRKQNVDLQTALRDERLQRENAVIEERREKGELLQRLQQEQEDKHNVQTDLDEARTQIEQLSEEKANLQQLLNEKQREKATIEELLSDAVTAIERHKQEKEVYKIPSHDIQLTGTELGHGSYGIVCVGYWRDCSVAVKLLYDHLAAVQRNIQLVQQEASVAWKIHHPNIAAVCGVTLELEENKAWIIMELHSGSMSGVIDACQGDVAPLTLREKVDMTHDSLCGLDYIHNMQPKEILHGDICPRNILVTATMRAKLGDLGAARFEDASLSVGLLSSQYTPPERFDVPTLPKSTKTDMYSIGVTICELFTSLFPDREQRMDQVLLIRQIDVCALCKHLMRDDPATRPTATEARHIISRIRDTDEYKACPPKRMVKGKMDGMADVTLV
ncbi:probable serine/threonine-protein kinase DDB_G0281745 isoform X2 [Corticium candelabrum]|uniref:probable serine/threonine-protein kinase DDB_G0281745 isoform X2 n=1 Tax=Corticium candelabrum TaxID=121492 RepID=UPI002E275AA0|nr:probable serine/threonine-protein kinase DDB_G0281745 isoform X2 [Corticium candelabrum]